MANREKVDGDGVAEVGGALKNTGGDIDPLLPEDEREKRRIGEKRAKWAINVSHIQLSPYRYSSEAIHEISEAATYNSCD